LCDTATDPDFSILTVGTHNNCDSVTRVIEVPYVLPFLAQGRIHDVRLPGVRDIQQDYQERFGPNDYRPNLFVTYWSFRAMIGLLAIPLLFALATLWLTRGGRFPRKRWFGRLALITIPTPFLANISGWVFTEMGRQPWIVVPNPTGDQQVRYTVHEAVSHHGSGVVVTSLVTYTAIYAMLAVAWFWLLKRYVVEGPREHDAEPAAPHSPSDDEIEPLSFAY
jgi:cytochrome bd ubiquinol oxidase subunit I